MNAADPTQPTPRKLTPEELGACVRVFREMHQWSQEQLAEISGLSVRTIQRVEQSQQASLHTLRALGSAFEFDDVDALNKPFSIPNEEQLKAQKERFDREHVTLKALPLKTGMQLAKLAEMHMMDMSEPGFEMSREAAEAFAALVDCMRDYRDCADVYSETMKFDIYDDLQSRIDGLSGLGVSLRYAQRRIQLTWGNDAPGAKPLTSSVLYVIAFPVGKEPEEFATPRKAGIRV